MQENEYSGLFNELSFSDIEVEPVTDGTLVDVWQTREQRKRDCEITELLKTYVISYKNKVDFVFSQRKRVVNCLLVVLLFVSLAISQLVIHILFAGDEVTTANVIQIIAALGSCVGVVIGLLKVMMEYIFARDDEKYITDIVSSIQKNDLENKRLNMETKTENLTEEIE